MTKPRRVRVLINPKSGLWWSSASILNVLEEHWDVPGTDLSYQYSKTAQDGMEKAGRAIDDGIDVILIIGGDGMVNSIGSVLAGSGVALGVVPAGSGNGFARHFGIPLAPERAIRALTNAECIAIDVGTANGRPFFVTCSLAWDAALVRTFEKSPVRGVLPYVLAAAYEFLDYRAQPFRVELDGQEELTFSDPMVFTAANLTQFGGGARVAPKAQHDDGLLELVVMARQDMPRLLANVNRLFDGTIDTVPGVLTRTFRTLVVRREQPAPMQLDGELIDAPADVSVGVMPKALNVLVPRA